MSFKDIKGQDRAIEVLREHIKRSRLAKAYLFCGPEGIGKKMAARALAKAVNCLKEGIDPCDDCLSCRKVDKEQHPDVHILDAADEEIKIEYIRRLQSEAGLRPYEGRKKVFIINNAHNLNAASSNAFLKTLEEPAGESLIILVSDKPELLLKTIISRCRIIKFSPLKREDLTGILERDYAVPEAASHFLAYFYEGRLGSALRQKESGILEHKNRVIDEFAVSAGRGFSGFPIEKREDLRSCLNILASWFRDIYILKAGLPYDEIINLDRKAELSKQAQRFSFSDLEAALNVISDSLSYLERNVNLKLIQSTLRACVKLPAGS